MKKNKYIQPKIKTKKINSLFFNSKKDSFIKNFLTCLPVGVCGS